MDILCERQRILFVINRDGQDGAADYVKQLKKIYLGAALATRKDKLGGHTGTRKHPYRKKFIESALSARYHLRILENIIHGN